MTDRITHPTTVLQMDTLPPGTIAVVEAPDLPGFPLAMQRSNRGLWHLAGASGGMTSEDVMEKAAPTVIYHPDHDPAPLQAPQ